MTQNSGKCSTYNDHFIVKDTTQEEPNGGDTRGKVCRGDASMPSQGTPPTKHLDEFTNPDILQILLFQSFYNSISSPPPLLRGWEVGLKIPILLPRLVFRVTSPHPEAISRGPILSHLISINSDVFKRACYE